MRTESGHTPSIKRVLMLEDDQTEGIKIQSLIKKIDTELDLDWVSTPEQALKLIGPRTTNRLDLPYDLILADMYLDQDELGADFLAQASRVYPTHCLWLMSRQTSSQVEHDCNYAQAFPFIKKSSVLQDLRFQIENALQKVRLTKRIDSLPIPQVSVSQVVLGWCVFLLTLIGTLLFVEYKTLPITPSPSAPSEETLVLRPFVQAQVNSLLGGGLTPLIQNPEFYDRKAMKSQRDQVHLADFLN